MNKICAVCGKNFDAVPMQRKYCCTECEQHAKRKTHAESKKRRREQKMAEERARKYRSGMLDARLKEASEAGMTYAELQKAKTIELVRKGEL